MSDLRSRRRAETRERIIRATTELLADSDPASISMPGVAEASGLSLRTLYRYFATKGELLEAAGAWFDPQAWVEAAGRDRLDQIDQSNLLAYQRARFAEFDTNRPGLLAQLGTPGGRELRRQRLAGQRPPVRRVIEGLDLPLTDAELDDVVDAIIAVSSTAMFVELVDRMGRTADDAARLSVWLVDAIVANARATAGTDPAEGAGQAMEEQP
jgi:AcrR family transcriptional regulator